MANDEQAIRELYATWQRATADRDLATVMSLMAEDVVFLTGSWVVARDANMLAPDLGPQ